MNKAAFRNMFKSPFTIVGTQKNTVAHLPNQTEVKGIDLNEKACPKCGHHMMEHIAFGEYDEITKKAVVHRLECPRS